MGRRLKTHIRSPKNGKISLCGRMSVRMAEKDAIASCKECQRMAVSGKLEKQRFEKNAVATGNNQTGTPRFTEMQRAFARHPLVTTNPRKAAVDSGYSKSYAKSHAHALREQLSPLIIEYQEIAMKRAAISVAKVQSELAAMGFANIMDYYEVLPNGAMIPKKLNDLTREQAAAIQEIKVDSFEHPLTGEGEYRIISLKLVDKRASLVELGKTLGMFSRKGEDEEGRRREEALRDVPTEALEEAEALLMAAVSKSKSQRAKNEAIDGEFKELPAPGAVEQEDPIA